ncbi:NAD-dependent DNA ligase LigA [Cytophagales bacterium LB-30]|uniref:DNA ligase n=1 Tax=Shiella aurantiaca TaxID=3058365 RepID=A0ABT8F1V2_9BACT|nr:NAD-dependent DNA ligase LigA [Shiella aurantiaca]MDN4164344.1 NAD-dependent DNA ligase LigA [Shiella aurantiaca]
MNRAEAQQRILDLSNQINYYNQRYYQDSVSEISDFAFDQLLHELIALETQFPELKADDSPSQRVGGTITKTFETVTHKYPMLSLGNTYSQEELIDFDTRIQKGLDGDSYEYISELKFDGVAISLTYDNRKLVRAVTRGDGTRGDNITANAKTIRSIPLKLPDNAYAGEFEVRGEVFMPRSVFDQINKEKEDIGEAPLANPRNAASGTLKMQDSSIVAQRKLDCYLYSFLCDEKLANTHEEALHLLEQWGFQVSPTYRKCADIQAVMQYISEWETKRLELPLDTDGIVIKINQYQQQEELGFTAKSPRWAISYKYKAQSASTRLNGITYQVGRTGAITPVAELAPVLLAGTTVKRASLHNANEIARLDLRIGDHVWVEKGGEIIPKVTGVDLSQRQADSQSFVFTKNCPVCGRELIRYDDEAVHYCPNHYHCAPQVRGRVIHFVSRRAMNIDSLGEETINTFFNEGFIRNISDIYSLEANSSQLIGVEIDSKEYTHTHNLFLSLTLPKTLFGILHPCKPKDKTTLKNITDHIIQPEDLKSAKEFIDFDFNQLKNSSSSIIDRLTSFQAFLTLFADTCEIQNEDDIPISITISFILNLSRIETETLLETSKGKRNIYHLLSELKNRDLSLYDKIQDALASNTAIKESIQKLKNTTLQKKSIEAIIGGIEASKQQSFDKVLFGLGIRHIGETSAKILAYHFKNIDNLINADWQTLEEVDGIGEIMAKSIQYYFNDDENIHIINELKRHNLKLEIDNASSSDLLESTKLSGLKILTSGTLQNFTREQFISVVEKNGGEYLKSVSKKLSFIVAGEDMGPTKRQKAIKDGIKIITESDFLKLLEN